jgi:hypothetical protein
VYQSGHGNSSWFYRRNGVEAQYAYVYAWFTSNPGWPWQATGNQRWKDGVVPAPATKGSWSGWTPPLDHADGWTGDAPEVPAAVLGSQDLADLVWQQARTVQAGGHREFYTGGEPSRDIEDAAWVTYDPDGDWIRFDERQRLVEEGTPEVRTYFAWTDDAPCVTPPVQPEPGHIKGETKETGPTQVDVKVTRPREVVVPSAVDAGL